MQLMKKSSFKFGKSTSSSFRMQAYDAIRKAILSGKLKPGDRLLENEIADQMGISRGPLREALRQLEQDGFIVSHPYRETLVAETSPEVVEAVYVPMRRTIEIYAAQKAHTTLTENDFAHLKELVAQMDEVSKKDNLEEISELDYKFHQYLIHKSGGHGLQTIWNSIMNRIYSRFLIQGIHHSTLTEVVTEHQNFLLLLQEGNPEKITAHLLTHIT